MQCIYCNKEFEQYNTLHTRCSDQCVEYKKIRNTALRLKRKLKREERKCEICNKDIIDGGKALVCSAKCREIKYQKELVSHRFVSKKIPCAYCGEQIITTRQRSRFCTDKNCRNLYHGEQKKQEKKLKECRNCGREFKGTDKQNSCDRECSKRSVGGKFKVEWIECCNPACKDIFPVKKGSQTKACSKAECSLDLRLKTRSLKKWKKKHNIPIFTLSREPSKSEPTVRKCIQCNIEFTAVSTLRKYCSRTCSFAFNDIKKRKRKEAIEITSFKERSIPEEPKEKNIEEPIISWTLKKHDNSVETIQRLQEAFLAKNEVTVIESTYIKAEAYKGKLEPINTLTEVGVRTKGVMSNETGTKDYA